MSSISTPERYQALLSENLPAVRARIREAAAAAGRPPDAVRLIGVTKGHPLAALEAALAAGLHDLGENRVEEAEEKRTALGAHASAVRWHLIGHLQSRKARRAVEVGDLIHSVDSERLAERLARLGEERGTPVPVLVQVNTSGESSKSGLEGEDVVEQIHRIAELSGLRVEGLMTMAPFVEDEAVLRSAFAGLRSVLERVRAVTERVGGELSMGMTNDLEAAVREGSTMVRIGTALFGERQTT